MNTLIKYEFFMSLAWFNGILGMMNILSQNVGNGVMILVIAIFCQLIAGQWKPQVQLIKCIKRAGTNAAKMCEPGFSEAQYRQVYLEELTVELEANGYENPRQMAKDLVDSSDIDIKD